MGRYSYTYSSELQLVSAAVQMFGPTSRGGYYCLVDSANLKQTGSVGRRDAEAQSLIDSYKGLGAGPPKEFGQG